jgi:hypothetical protein
MLEKRSKNSSIAILKTYNHYATTPQAKPKKLVGGFGIALRKL